MTDWQPIESAPKTYLIMLLNVPISEVPMVPDVYSAFWRKEPGEPRWVLNDYDTMHEANENLDEWFWAELQLPDVPNITEKDLDNG